MSAAVSPFIFACCREGSEASLKADVLRRHGSLLTPAFMRPQLITWKARAPVDEGFDLGSPFARVSGLSLGPCKTEAEVVAKVTERSLAVVSLQGFPRVVPEDAEIDWSPLDAIRDRVATALEKAGVRLDEGAGHVLSLIVDEKPEAPLFTGLRKHQPGDPIPSGGLPRITIPAHAPSRAWLKVEQALAWRGWDRLDLRGQTALDLGCAPGVRRCCGMMAALSGICVCRWPGWMRASCRPRCRCCCVTSISARRRCCRTLPGCARASRRSG